LDHFISLISKIYIAPLREIYSNVVLTPAQLNISLKMREEQRREGSWEGVEAPWEAITGRGAHHRESALLPSGVWTRSRPCSDEQRDRRTGNYFNKVSRSET